MKGRGIFKARLLRSAGGICISLSDQVLVG